MSKEEESENISEEEAMILNHILFKRKFRPTKKTLLHYDLAKSNGFQGDFNDFINDIVLKFKKKHGSLKKIFEIGLERE